MERLCSFLESPEESLFFVSASRCCPLSLARGPFHHQSQHWPVGSFSQRFIADAPSCLPLPSFKDSEGCMGPPESPGKSSHLKGSWLATLFPSVTLIPLAREAKIVTASRSQNKHTDSPWPGLGRGGGVSTCTGTHSWGGVQPQQGGGRWALSTGDTSPQALLCLCSPGPPAPSSPAGSELPSPPQ